MASVKLRRDELLRLSGKLDSTGEAWREELVVKAGEGGTKGVLVKLNGSESEGC